jgi:hypothetical protein
MRITEDDYDINCAVVRFYRFICTCGRNIPRTGGQSEVHVPDTIRCDCGAVWDVDLVPVAKNRMQDQQGSVYIRELARTYGGDDDSNNKGI